MQSRKSSLHRGRSNVKLEDEQGGVFREASRSVGFRGPCVSGMAGAVARSPPVGVFMWHVQDFLFFFNKSRS